MFVETDFNSFYCGLLVKIKYNIKNESGGGGEGILLQDKKNELQCERKIE
jgi:hypothetical protein